MEKRYRVRAPASVITGWQFDEEGSWEDHGCPQDAGHVYPILDRHRTVIEMRDLDEVRMVLESAKYHGTYSYWSDDRVAFRAAVGRIARQLQTILEIQAMLAEKESK